MGDAALDSTALALLLALRPLHYLDHLNQAVIASKAVTIFAEVSMHAREELLTMEFWQLMDATS